METPKISAIHHPFFCCTLPGYMALVGGIVIAAALSFFGYYSDPLFKYWAAAEAEEVDFAFVKPNVWLAIAPACVYLLIAALWGLAAIGLHIRLLEKNRGYLAGRFRKELKNQEWTEFKIYWMFLLPQVWLVLDDGIAFILVFGGFYSCLLLAHKKRASIYLEAANLDTLPAWREFSLRAKAATGVAITIVLAIISAVTTILVRCGLGFAELADTFRAAP